MLPLRWLQEAEARLASHVVITPVTYDASLDLYLKWENQQVTGSFKARGALNKVLTLQGWERERGLVTASAGNHGQGLAYAGRLAGAAVTVFAGNHAVSMKLDAMQELGAQVHLTPGGYGEVEAAGLRYATEQQATWVSAYNDGHVIAGQAGVALETLRQLPRLKECTWLVPVGGGGLLSGTAAVARNAGHRVVGVQAHTSPFFHAMFHRGSQQDVEDLPGLADGLAGAVEANSITLPLARSMVADVILVDETAIAAAIAYAWREHDQVIEGAGAVGLAAALTGLVTARPAVAIISGGNIQPELHAEILSGHYRG